MLARRIGKRGDSTMKDGSIVVQQRVVSSGGGYYTDTYAEVKLRVQDNANTYIIISFTTRAEYPSNSSGTITVGVYENGSYSTVGGSPYNHSTYSDSNVTFSLSTNGSTTTISVVCGGISRTFTTDKVPLKGDWIVTDGVEVSRNKVS